MGRLHRIDRRHESRSQTELKVTIWGVDTKGDRFLQEAHARETSVSGALLSGLDVELRSGDVLGLLYAGKKARYRVVWVRYCGGQYKIQAAIHRIEPDVCPWSESLAEDGAAPATPDSVSSRPE